MSAAPVIAGYASLFGVRDRSGDRVLPGAFRASLKSRGTARIAMLWQHDPAQPIGRWERLGEDRRGLWVIGRLLPGVTLGREAAALIGAGAVSGLSIGFQARRAQKSRQGAERLLSDIDLWEVSVVTFPQVDGARVRIVRPNGAVSI